MWLVWPAHVGAYDTPAIHRDRGAGAATRGECAATRGECAATRGECAEGIRRYQAYQAREVEVPVVREAHGEEEGITRRIFLGLYVMAGMHGNEEPEGPDARDQGCPVES